MPRRLKSIYYKAVLLTVQTNGDYMLLIKQKDKSYPKLVSVYLAKYDFDWPFICAKMGFDVTCCGETDGSGPCKRHGTTLESMIDRAGDWLEEKAAKKEVFEIFQDDIEEYFAVLPEVEIPLKFWKEWGVTDYSTPIFDVYDQLLEQRRERMQRETTNYRYAFRL